MRKLFLFLLVFLSSQSFAQKEKIIGSWKLKSYYKEYTVETFFANGNYRTDIFQKDGNFWLHIGIPDAGKWTLDSDGVLCTFGTMSTATSFAKLEIAEDDNLTAAEKKRLKDNIPQLEKTMSEKFKNVKSAYQKSYFDVKFNEDGELQKRSAEQGGGIWYTFIKTDLPWTPARNATKGAAPKKSVPQRRK